MHWKNMDKCADGLYVIEVMFKTSFNTIQSWAVWSEFHGKNIGQVESESDC